MISTRKTNNLILAGLLILLALASVAEVSAAKLLYGQGRFWRLEHVVHDTSYLFGTVHVPDKSVTEVPAAVDQAIDRAEFVAFEILQDEKAQKRAGELMTLPQQQSLRALIGDQLFTQSGIIAARYGLQPQQIDRLKPWALVTVFSLTPKQMAMRQKGIQALDFQLQNRAAAKQKKLVGLEDLMSQLRIFDSMPKVEQVQLLDVTVKAAQRQEEMMQNLITKYLNSDLDGIYDMMVWQNSLAGPEFAAKFEERFLLKRNRQMARKALNQMKRGSTFIAVGALHLPGKEGLVNLFAKKGYRATRIKLLRQ